MPKPRTRMSKNTVHTPNTNTRLKKCLDKTNNLIKEAKILSNDIKKQSVSINSGDRIVIDDDSSSESASSIDENIGSSEIGKRYFEPNSSDHIFIDNDNPNEACYSINKNLRAPQIEKKPLSATSNDSIVSDDDCSNEKSSLVNGNLRASQIIKGIQNQDKEMMDIVKKLLITESYEDDDEKEEYSDLWDDTNYRVSDEYEKHGLCGNDDLQKYDKRKKESYPNDPNQVSKYMRLANELELKLKEAFHEFYDDPTPIYSDFDNTDTISFSQNNDESKQTFLPTAFTDPKKDEKGQNLNKDLIECKVGKICPPKNQPENNISIGNNVKDNNKFNYRKSETTTEKAWSRAYKKFIPDTEMMLSPVKPIECILRPVGEHKDDYLPEDDLVSGYSWVSSMTEQFYYDNSLTLVSSNQDNMSTLKKALLTSIHPKCMNYYQKNWSDLTPLGSGTYGDVIRVFDKGDETHYAVKILKSADSDDIHEHRQILLDYLRERNYLVKAKSSPLIVKFYSSIQLPDSGLLMLIFEFCPGSLRDIIQHMKKVSPSDSISYGMLKKSNNVLRERIEQFSELFNFNILDFLSVYVFELFCILDYLAKCNIIHCDIKPDNFMIGENLHLRLADFGLIYNINFITRKSQVLMPKHTEIDKTESSNFGPRVCGTSRYFDPELHMHSISKEPKYKRWLDGVTNELFTTKYDYSPRQDFMSDTFATGLIIGEILFLGQNVFTPYGVHMAVSQALDLEPTMPDFYNILKIFLFKNNFKRYITDGFKAISYAEVSHLLALLLSTLLPREKRSQKFVSIKQFKFQTHDSSLPHIDITKIEKITNFKKMKLTSRNVFLFQIDKSIGSIFQNKKERTKYENIDQFVTKWKAKNANEQFFDLKPGIEGNF